MKSSSRSVALVQFKPTHNTTSRAHIDARADAARSSAMSAIATRDSLRRLAAAAARRAGAEPSPEAWHRRRALASASPWTVAHADRRDYAKGGGPRSAGEKSITPPAFASQARATQIRAFLKSPGVIADPYRGRRPWPSASSLLSLDGWRQLVKLALMPVKDIYTLGNCQYIEGFSRPAFREEARLMYKEISRMIAGNHHTALRHTCSEKALAEIKKEVKARERGGWDGIDWNLIGFDENTPTVLQGRMVAPNASDRSVAFVQFTVRFNSRQTYAAYDKRGRVVAGDPDQVLSVEDVWVFERGLKVPNARWRLAARLSVPNPGQTVGGEVLDPNIG